MIGSLPARIEAKIEPEPNSGCWLWTGFLQKNGYPRVAVRSQRDGSWRVAMATRVIYELLVGPIPEGLELDHLCRVRSCVNPAHLDPVTRRTNQLRGQNTFTALHANKVTCIRGHAFSQANTYQWKGGRYCRACRRESQRKWRTFHSS